MFTLCRRNFFRCLVSSARTFHGAHRPHYALVRPRIALIARRGFATPPSQLNESDLPVEAYHSLSDTTMQGLLAALEELLDDIGSPDHEVDYHSGVLTLSLGERGTYVINKQPPNKQIWLSSPFSGPKRYSYSSQHDDWIYSRDGVAIGDLLNRELSEVLGQTVNLGITSISTLGQ